MAADLKEKKKKEEKRTHTQRKKLHRIVIQRRISEGCLTAWIEQEIAWT